MVRIILIYGIAISFILLKLRQPFFSVNQEFIGQIFSLFSALYVCIFFFEVYRNKHGFYIILYSIISLLSLYFIQHESFSVIFSYISPLFIICSCYNKNDNKYLKPLSFLFISLFVLNGAISLYERLTETYIMEPDANDKVLMYQMNYGIEESANFRSFALFGHPLTNSNIMASMSFMFLYNNRIPDKVRFAFAALGFASLFCFNSRATIIISGLLLIPFLVKYYKYEVRRKFVFWCCIICIFTMLISNFSTYAGRLASGDIVDESAMARLATVYAFMNLSLSELIVGGNMDIMNENGYLAIIAWYGLIIGLLKIVLEIRFAYVFVRNDNRLTKFLIMSSLILIGSTNNNLAYPIVFPMYIMSLLFVNNISLKDNQ